tara:strand:+ start:20 stop:580 length:561 start_codon:yes stop_codon:yes gene_type:complete
MKALRTKKLITLFVGHLALGLNTFTVFAEEKNVAPDLPDCKILLGEIEKLNLVKFDATLSARIDTGATISSVDAHNIQIYRRNKNRWVQFETNMDNQTITLDAQLLKYIGIKQQATTEDQLRPVVLMDIKIGQLVGSYGFSLSNREHLKVKALIGRNVLEHQALVDVSKQFIQSEEHGEQSNCVQL